MAHTGDIIDAATSGTPAVVNEYSSTSGGNVMVEKRIVLDSLPDNPTAPLTEKLRHVTIRVDEREEESDVGRWKCYIRVSVITVSVTKSSRLMKDKTITNSDSTTMIERIASSDDYQSVIAEAIQEVTDEMNERVQERQDASERLDQVEEDLETHLQALYYRMPDYRVLDE